MAHFRVVTYTGGGGITLEHVRYQASRGAVPSAGPGSTVQPATVILTYRTGGATYTVRELSDMSGPGRGLNYGFRAGAPSVSP